MLAVEGKGVTAVERKDDSPVATFALDPHGNRPEGGEIDLDVEHLDRRYEHVPAVRLATKNGREEAHHRRPPDRLAFVIPGAVTADAHA